MFAGLFGAVEVELDVAVCRGVSALLTGLFDQGGVAGVFGEHDGAAGEDAEKQGGGGGQTKADGCGDADGAALLRIG